MSEDQTVLATVRALRGAGFEILISGAEVLVEPPVTGDVLEQVARLRARPEAVAEALKLEAALDALRHAFEPPGG